MSEEPKTENPSLRSVSEDPGKMDGKGNSGGIIFSLLGKLPPLNDRVRDAAIYLLVFIHLPDFQDFGVQLAQYLGF